MPGAVGSIMRESRVSGSSSARCGWFGRRQDWTMVKVSSMRKRSVTTPTTFQRFMGEQWSIIKDYGATVKEATVGALRIALPRYSMFTPVVTGA